MDLSEKTALITGASRGIGAATARLLAEHGARIAVNYIRNKKAAEKITGEINDKGGRALALKADVSNLSESRKMVEKTIRELGPVDILILNAGAAVPWKPFPDLSIREFENKVFGEIRGFLYPLKAVLPGMLERKKGCIVGISSGLSRRAGFGFSAHTTAKSGVDGLMKSLSLELGPKGIRVNTISPGLIRTDATAWLSKKQFDDTAKATPLRRVGEPKDVAGAILMMVSDYAGFVTGAYLPVNGGSLMV